MAKAAQADTLGDWLGSHPTLNRFDLEIALCQVLDCSRAFLLSHPERQLTANELEQLHRWSHQLYNHVPLAYLCGEQEFWGLALKVDERVLVPRPDTETLVEQALVRLEQMAPQASLARLASRRALSVLDLGTGSGAIALAIASERPDADVHACDLSPDSLAVAEANSRKLKLAVTFHHSDWFNNIQQRYDLIVANPPYIDPLDPHLATLGAEPRMALVSRDRGLWDLGHIAAQGESYLHPGGYLLLEHGFDQGPAVRDLLVNNGFEGVSSCRDLGGNERVTWGQKKDRAESNHE